ncbi:MAG TPA: MFS transporter [Candidatus Bathyarchaeia archaeon]|nr:MFS transporter [Candidatus Bathyarchaeia archaeon]
MRVRRRAAAIAFIGLVFLGLPAGMLGIAWPTMRASLGAPFAGLGLLVAAMTVAQFAASAASGILRERLGTIVLLLLSVAAACAGLGLFAIASGWLATIVASAVLGCGVGLLDAAVNTEAALRGDIRFMSGLHGAWAIGASLGPPLVGATLVASDSWRPAYVVAAAAFAILGLAIYAVRSDLSAAPEIKAEPPGARGIGRPVVIACALMFVYVGIELGGGQWTYTRFTADGSLSDALAGLAVFLFWSALAAGRIALAALGDRVAPARLFDLSVFGALASTLGFSVLPAPIAALVALPCLGATLSVFVPVLLYLTPRRIGSAAAPRAIGYQVAAGMIGGAFLPAAVGLLMQSVGVAILGPCLVTMAAVLTGLHLVATRPIGSRGYARQLFR